MSAAQGPIPLALKPYSPELEKEWREDLAVSALASESDDEAVQAFIRAGKLYNPPVDRPGPVEYALKITGNVEILRSILNAKVQVSLPRSDDANHPLRLVHDHPSKSPELTALITEAVRQRRQSLDAPAPAAAPKRPSGPTHEDFENALRRESPAANLKLIQSMLDRGVQVQNGDLDIAIRNPAISHDVIRLLIQRGAAIQQPTPRDEGALARAIFMKRPEATIQLLIESRGSLRRDFQPLGAWDNPYSPALKARIETLIQQAVVDREPEVAPVLQPAPAREQVAADEPRRFEFGFLENLYHALPDGFTESLPGRIFFSILEGISHGVYAVYRGIAYVCTEVVNFCSRLGDE